MQRFFEGKKWMLAVAILLAGGYTRAQGTQDTLTLNLDKALEIALSDNPGQSENPVVMLNLHC